MFSAGSTLSVAVALSDRWLPAIQSLSLFRLLVSLVAVAGDLRAARSNRKWLVGDVRGIEDFRQPIKLSLCYLFPFWTPVQNGDVSIYHQSKRSVSGLLLRSGVPKAITAWFLPELTKSGKNSKRAQPSNL